MENAINDPQNGLVDPIAFAAFFRRSDRIWFPAAASSFYGAEIGERWVS